MTLKSTLKTTINFTCAILTALLSISCSDLKNEDQEWQENNINEKPAIVEDQRLVDLLTGLSGAQVLSLESTVEANNETITVVCNFSTEKIYIGYIDSIEGYDIQAMEVLKECLLKSPNGAAFREAHENIFNVMTGGIKGKIEFARDTKVTTDMTMTPNHRNLEVIYQSPSTRYKSNVELSHQTESL